MTCDEIRAQYLDRDFDLRALDAARKIAEHLSTCQACRQAAGQYDQLRSLLKAPGGDEGPGDLEPAELTLPELEPARAAHPSKPRTSNRSGWAIAQAAIILLAIIGWGLYFTHRQEKQAPAPEIAQPRPAVEPIEKNVPLSGAVMPADLRWTRSDVDRGVAVFTKVSESFDGRAGWVAVGDRASDMGLIDGPAMPPPKVLLVRLLMSLGDKTPSKTDLVIVPGQEVSVELPFAPGEVLQYHIKTTTGPRPRLTLAAEVRSLEHGETLAALATQLEPQAGQALSAGRLLSRSGLYNLDVSFSETALSSIH